MTYCLDSINQNLEQLPRHDDVQMAVVRVKRIASEANIYHLLEKGLLEFIDELQISIGDIHDELSGTWFGPVEQAPPTPELAAIIEKAIAKFDKPETSAKNKAPSKKKHSLNSPKAKFTIKYCLPGDVAEMLTALCI